MQDLTDSGLTLSKLLSNGVIWLVAPLSKIDIVCLDAEHERTIPAKLKSISSSVSDMLLALLERAWLDALLEVGSNCNTRNFYSPSFSRFCYSIPL